MPDTPPEQTNDRPDREGNAGQGELNPDQTEPGRPRIRPVPGDERDGGGDEGRGSDDGISGPGEGEINPDQMEPGRPRIRPVPGDERG